MRAWLLRPDNREEKAKHEQELKAGAKNKHAAGYEAVTRMAEMQAEMRKEVYYIYRDTHLYV
jgi:hypothetical protein